MICACAASLEYSGCLKKGGRYNLQGISRYDTRATPNESIELRDRPYASGMAATTASDGDITHAGVRSSQVRRQLGYTMFLSHNMV